MKRVRWSRVRTAVRRAPSNMPTIQSYAAWPSRAAADLGRPSSHLARVCVGWGWVGGVGVGAGAQARMRARETRREAAEGGSGCR